MNNKINYIPEKIQPATHAELERIREICTNLNREQDIATRSTQAEKARMLRDYRGHLTGSIVLFCEPDEGAHKIFPLQEVRKRFL